MRLGWLSGVLEAHPARWSGSGGPLDRKRWTEVLLVRLEKRCLECRRHLLRRLSTLPLPYLKANVSKTLSASLSVFTPEHCWRLLKGKGTNIEVQYYCNIVVNLGLKSMCDKWLIIRNFTKRVKS